MREVTPPAADQRNFVWGEFGCWRSWSLRRFRMNFAPVKARKIRLGEIGGVLKLLIGDDCTNKDGHVLGAHDLHLGTGDDHLIGGKRSGAPELTLDSDETLR